MAWRACFVVLMTVVAPAAMAAQAAAKKTHAEPATTTRAQLDAARGQASAEDASVRQLKAKVSSLESQSDASAKALADRDRKIEELQKQLAAEHQK